MKKILLRIGVVLLGWIFSGWVFSSGAAPLFVVQWGVMTLLLVGVLPLRRLSDRIFLGLILGLVMTGVFWVDWSSFPSSIPPTPTPSPTPTPVPTPTPTPTLIPTFPFRFSGETISFLSFLAFLLPFFLVVVEIPVALVGEGLLRGIFTLFFGAINLALFFVVPGDFSLWRAIGLVLGIVGIMHLPGIFLFAILRRKFFYERRDLVGLLFLGIGEVVYSLLPEKNPIIMLKEIALGSAVLFFLLGIFLFLSFPRRE